MDYKEKVIALLNSQELSKEQKEKLENIFPELKESEDEKIKRIIYSIIDKIGFHIHDIFTEEEFQCFDAWSHAWLEKQSNKKQVEHLELKAGHWYICHRPYCCRADNLTVKEGEKFQCVNDGVVKGFVIKEPEKYFMEINTPKDGLNDEVRRISTIQVLEYAKSLDVYNQYGKEDIDKNIAWLEKQGEKVTNINGEDYGIDANKKVDRVIGTADHIKTALDVLNKKGGEE